MNESCFKDVYPDKKLLSDKCLVKWGFHAQLSMVDTCNVAPSTSLLMFPAKAN